MQTSDSGRPGSLRFPHPLPRHPLPIPHPGVTLPAHRPRPAIPAQGLTAPRTPGLDGFNAAADSTAQATLLGCCASLRWARRVAAHRPYPDLEALLAAAEEAAYDLSPAELTEALGREALALPPGAGQPVAHTALSAAHARYESTFGYAFVMCLDDYAPREALDQVLTGIRSRMDNDAEKERALAGEELRRVALGRLRRLLSEPSSAPVPPGGSLPPKRYEPADSDRPDSLYVPV
ncbi:2-oxo-4-hydroxy-4-carboxy-5-ureidoimidazoline decarboxylase [Streptomyces sp. NPDC058045]|uniref:2-oxo-4-hydroxy-4-carboxy-5-ureidoimidazoline decarboxylase n=1 Tax=Streptomyces sp. NPDC058045 TaxID=3346311 RepID=UPI0036E9FFA0